MRLVAFRKLLKERKKKKEKYAGIFPGYVILFSTRD